MMPNDPNKKDEEDKKKKNPNGTYEDAPYHHRNSRGDKGGKSASPIDGQAALNNSVSLGGASLRRVGVSNGQIVVLSQTSEGVYHGYVANWQTITRTPKMANIEQALRQNGLVDKFGKILCK